MCIRDRIRTGSRLGHSDRRHEVAGDETAEPPILLFVVRVRQEIGEAHVVVEGDAQRRGTDTHDGCDLVDDDVVAEVVDTAAAVAFGDGHSEKALSPRRSEHGFVDDPTVAPLGMERLNLSCDEVLDALSKEIVVRFEDGAPHFSSRGSTRPYCNRPRLCETGLMPDLILASSSPRRRFLLSAAGFAFSTESPHVDEEPRDGEEPDRMVVRLAGEKALAVMARPGVVVIAADTTVVLDGRILGKPSSVEEASTICLLYTSPSPRDRTRS